jgi:hypothetical protein
LPVFSRQVFPPLSNILDYILFHFRLKSFTYQVKSIKDLTGNIYSFVKQLFLAMENKTTGLLTHLLLLFLKNFSHYLNPVLLAQVKMNYRLKPLPLCSIGYCMVVNLQDL